MPEEQEDVSAAADSGVQVKRTVQRSETAIGRPIVSIRRFPTRRCRRPVLVPPSSQVTSLPL